MHRLVMAGDSWSVGLVMPTIDALADLGFDATLTWEATAVAGSTAAQWVTNDGGKLLALDAALDADPPAEVLLLVIGGNDLNREINGGWAKLPKFFRELALDDIRDDVQNLIGYAMAGRPDLQVVMVGYDYLHYDFLQLYVSLPGLDQQSYNEAFIALEQRKLGIAQANSRVHYAHNLGLLQWTFGDVPHPPFFLPPVAYGPGAVPAPGVWPTYTPFPGGLVQLPGPLDYLPDGIHPSLEGFRVIIDHTFAQGLEALMLHEPWGPSP
ncbi:MAG: hypothetical protein H6746_01060 [Deltaproteobacteria bacterium]|nr:hypothetical protein [Deltaproteobacteria bacterium]